MDLSIVILCYRSEESIITFVEKAREVGRQCTDEYEIILVGNYIEGRDDRTGEIISEIASNYDRIQAIVKPKEGMMGWDMKCGMAASKGDVICVIDGDGQFPLDSIKDCYKLMVEDDLDLVKTYRVSREDGWYRTSISKVYNTLFSLLFSSVNSRDINSKPKLIKRPLYNHLNLESDDWFIDAEIMIKASANNANIKEIPIEFFDQHGRASFVKPGAILEFLNNMIRYRMKKK